MQIKRYSIVPFFLIASLLTGCGGSPAVNNPSPEQTIHEKKKNDNLNNALMMSAATVQTPIEEHYLIGPEDLLDIEAYNVDELKKTVRVNSQGEIALPLVGIINVKGLSTSDVEKLIAKKLDRYVQQTVVTVFVREYKSQRVSVIGAVKKPQVFAITGQRYLLDMLMMAEGLAGEAGNICYVIRPTLKTNPNSKAETIIIDLDELIMKGNFSLNIPVFAGDIVNVPRGGIFFVDGEIKAPGVYTMKGKTTLIQALTMAQGVGPLADHSEVRVYRDNGKGEREIIMVDYEEIKNGARPDMVIAENDIIIVPKSGAKDFFNTFTKAVRGAFSIGGFSMGF